MEGISSGDKSLASGYEHLRSTDGDFENGGDRSRLFDLNDEPMDSLHDDEAEYLPLRHHVAISHTVDCA
ncbi:hypothetical protein BGX28_007070 [Mortierella sp. GBA30]|nr:hypothetical protein BGX28_007070 [Mortierella sp. GBA30]